MDVEKELKIVIGVLVAPFVREVGGEPAAVESSPSAAGRGQCRILISRRRSDAVLGGLWEFPGGKIEAGETPEDALIREFREELGITVTPGRRLGEIHHAYDHGRVHLLPMFCHFPPGPAQVPLNLEVVDHRWVFASELCELPFPEANRLLIDEVRALLL